MMMLDKENEENEIQSREVSSHRKIFATSYSFFEYSLIRSVGKWSLSIPRFVF